MEKGEVDCKWHSQNMEVMKGMHTDMKRTNKTIKETIDQKRDMSKTKMYMALLFVFKDSERYEKRVERFWESTNEPTAEEATIMKGKTTKEDKEEK